MQAPSHVLIAAGLTSAAISIGIFPDGHGAAAIVPYAAAIAGSLLPDVDHPRSWAGKRIWPVSAIIGMIFGHRGITHSLVAAIALGLLAAVLPLGASPTWIFPLGFGYLSHLVADWMTPSGIPLLWPVRKSFICPVVQIRTGSITEKLISAAFLGLVILRMVIPR